MTERQIHARLAKLEDDKLTGHAFWVLWLGGCAVYCVAIRDSPLFLALLLVAFAFHVTSIRPQWRRYKAAKALLGPDEDDEDD